MNSPMLFNESSVIARSAATKQSARAQATLTPCYSLCLLLILLLTSCSYTEVGKPLPATNTVKTGEKFFINLPENHAESFMWKLNDDYDKNLLENINSVWHGNEKGVDYHFKTKQKGQDTLNFTLYKYNEVSRYISFVVKAE